MAQMAYRKELLSKIEVGPTVQSYATGLSGLQILGAIKNVDDPRSEGAGLSDALRAYLVSFSPNLI